MYTRSSIIFDTINILRVQEKMQKHGVSSILCYSKVQGRGTGEQDRIVLLLWKDRRSSLHTSAQFYSGVMCEREKGEGEVEAMGRCFAHKTQGFCSL